MRERKWWEIGTFLCCDVRWREGEALVLVVVKAQKKKDLDFVWILATNVLKRVHE